jgi:hypothetical protein
LACDTGDGNQLVICNRSVPFWMEQLSSAEAAPFRGGDLT